MSGQNDTQVRRNVLNFHPPVLIFRSLHALRLLTVTWKTRTILTTSLNELLWLRAVTCRSMNTQDECESRWMGAVTETQSQVDPVFCSVSIGAFIVCPFLCFFFMEESENWQCGFACSRKVKTAFRRFNRCVANNVSNIKKEVLCGIYLLVSIKDEFRSYDIYQRVFSEVFFPCYTNTVASLPDRDYNVQLRET